jgi:alginate O-acetyltransferase complex protein AlgI
VPAVFQVATTFFLAVIGWVLFRAESFGRARDWLSALFRWRGGDAPSPWLWSAIAIAAIVSFACPNTFDLSHDWPPLQAAALTMLFVIAIFIMYVGRQTPFLYFQF